ncbi:SNARE associated Golgi protein [Dillenia turbinata]|uniref:SNARE associated Golgi protein n=1 Tax=Dillenia turbinata TaxID=194707 RepID=A0AAN8YYV0_9MAGN
MSYNSKPNLGRDSREYERLSNNDQVDVGGEFEEAPASNPNNGNYSIWGIWRWIKIGVLFVSVVVLALVFVKWAGPIFINKGNISRFSCLFMCDVNDTPLQMVVPVLNWAMTTFSTQVLAVVIFASLALFPVVMLPSSPSIWLAGIIFGYGIGFLLTEAGMMVGFSLPYFIGSLFRDKVQASIFMLKILITWLEKHPRKAAIVRLASEGDWLYQFRVVFLIRVSPFPYPILNYVIVPTNIQYIPYLFGSIIGIVPDVLVGLYSGDLMRTFADDDNKPHTKLQMIFDIVGLCVTIAATVIIGISAKRRLEQLEREELVCE